MRFFSQTKKPLIFEFQVGKKSNFGPTNGRIRLAIVLKQSPRCSKLVERLAFHMYQSKIFLITYIPAEPFAGNYV